MLQREYEDLADMHYKEVNKTKVTKKELKKHLSEKEEENLRLKNLNKKLLEQIRDLKNEKIKSQNSENKVDKSETKEVLRLRNHNQNLLTQIKKLKCDKMSFKDKLEQLTQEVSKSPSVTVQVEDKEISRTNEYHNSRRMQTS